MLTAHGRKPRRAAAYALTTAAALAISGIGHTAAASPPGPAAATGAGAVGPAAAANPTSGYWTGTWAAAPQSGGSAFNQQTIRQIVHTSISGTVARIELSNAFGSAPLTVNDVHLAQAGPGSSILAGTDHTATFAGASATTIPAGGTAISDSINLTVPAQSNIAISLYLPNTTGASTYHNTALQTS